MSETKARLVAENKALQEELTKLRQDVVFLLQSLWDIHYKHPEVDLPDLGNDRFDEWTWRNIT